MLGEIAELSKEALSVLLVLRYKADGKGKGKVELTGPELSRLADVGIAAVARAINELEHEGYIERSSYGIKINDVTLAYKAQTTDENRLATLEREYTELLKQYAESDESRLQQVLRGEILIVVQEMEDYLQRPLTAAESIHVGILYGRYGAKRLMDAYREARDSRFPLRTTWNILSRGGKGSAFTERNKNEADYQKVGSIKDI